MAPCIGRMRAFMHEYQSAWLPTAGSPPTLIEVLLNRAIPIFVAIGAVLIFPAIVSTARALRNRTLPDNGPLIATSLVICLVGVAAFQSGKNFYETALILPLFAMAVMFSLTTKRLPDVPLIGGRTILATIAVLAADSARLPLHFVSIRNFRSGN